MFIVLKGKSKNKCIVAPSPRRKVINDLMQEYKKEKSLRVGEGSSEVRFKSLSKISKFYGERRLHSKDGSAKQFMNK